MHCQTVSPAGKTASATIVCIETATPSPISYATPAVALLSFIVSAIIALRALRNTRSVARQKATLDLIEKRESTEHYRAISRIFFELLSGPGFMHLVDPAPQDKPTRKAVFDYLNHYEIIAIGIRQDILDERIYRAWMEGAFVRDWNAAAEFVQRQRWKYADGQWRYRASVYENYQHVACKWSKDALRLTEASFPPPASPAGPGDRPLPEPIDDIELDD
jgi:hypothetical protein